MSQQNRIRLLNENDRPVNHENDEIDLLALLLLLWEGKKVIVLCVIAMLITAVSYLAIVQEKWTSTALIQRPSSGQMVNYSAAMKVLYTLFPQDSISMDEQRNQVFKEFVSNLSSADLQSKYILDSDYFSALLSKRKQTDEYEQNFLLEQELRRLNVAPLYKNNNDIIQLTFTADTADEARKMLSDYIRQIADITTTALSGDVRRRLAVQQNDLESVLKTQLQVAEVKKQNRISTLKEALKVAKASEVKGVKIQQAENLSDDSLFLLGVSALQAMIANESTRLPSFDQRYYETQQSYLMVKDFKLQERGFDVFNYLKSPDLPVAKDSPKTVLILVLSVLIGGVLGAGVVLVRNLIKNYRKIYY